MRERCMGKGASRRAGAGEKIDFFSILIEGGQRLMTISRATLPLGPKGF